MHVIAIPAGFAQLLIIICWDAFTKIYFPLYFVLLQSKHYLTYYNALQQIINSSDWKLEAMSTNCDYEHGLFTAINEQFPPPAELSDLRHDGSANWGCDFHLAQANIRELVSLLGFTREELEAAKLVGSNLWRLLTECKVSELESKSKY